jgi:hypothetical protein
VSDLVFSTAVRLASLIRVNEEESRPSSSMLWSLGPSPLTAQFPAPAQGDLWVSL